MREQDELTAFDKAFELAARLTEVTLVALTDQGRRLATDLDEARRRAAHTVLGDATATQLRAFITVTDRIIDHVGRTPTEAD